MKRILFVEDDANLSGIVQESLEELGFGIKVVRSGEEAIEAFSSDLYELILMDIELEGHLDGFCAAETIRKAAPSIPILFATARQSGDDLERGFRMGKMDYVRKPYRMKEILLRIEGLLGPTHTLNGLIQVGSLTFDPVMRRIYGKEVNQHLTNLEANLFFELCNKRNKVVCKEALILTLWGDVDDPKSKESSLHNLIYNLRKYLKPEPRLQVEVVAKNGYRLEEMVECK